MRTCLFVHDFRSYTFKDKTYSTNLSYDILKDRYLSHFDKLKILNRTKCVCENPSSSMVLSSGDGVEFLNEIDFFSGIDFFQKYSKYKKIVIDEVSASCFVIIRLDSFLGLIAADACRKLNKPYLIEVAGCVWDSFWNKGILGKLIAPWLFAKTRYVIRNANHVIYVTDNFLQKRYPTLGKNIACSNVMLPGIDYDMVLTKRIKHIDESRKIIKIATIASIDVPYKNQEAVIRALGVLKRRGILNYSYELIGGGDSKRLHKIAMLEGVLDEVVFVGSVKHQKIRSILDDIDIYIQPSKQEGLPRSLVEAMSCGCYCIGSNVAGIPELLDKDTIFSVHSQKQLVDKILDFNKESAKDKAIQNIKKSRKYMCTTLEKRRYNFISEAIDESGGFSES